MADTPRAPATATSTATIHSDHAAAKKANPAVRVLNMLHRITAKGKRAVGVVKRVITKDSTRHRWPSAEAVVQVFFRGAAVLVNFVPLILYLIVKKTLWEWPRITLLSTVYSTALCVTEIATVFLGSYSRRLLWLRIPAYALLLADLGAAILFIWSFHLILRPNFRHRMHKGRLTNDQECPPETCVSEDEEYQIVVFNCQMLLMMIHATFFFLFMKDNVERYFRNRYQRKQEKDFQLWV